MLAPPRGSSAGKVEPPNHANEGTLLGRHKRAVESFIGWKFYAMAGSALSPDGTAAWSISLQKLSGRCSAPIGHASVKERPATHPRGMKVSRSGARAATNRLRCCKGVRSNLPKGQIQVTSVRRARWYESVRSAASPYFATGFRCVGSRKIMTFLGSPQTFLSLVFVGFFSFAIIIFTLSQQDSGLSTVGTRRIRRLAMR